jgi:hypothetical protein
MLKQVSSIVGFLSSCNIGRNAWIVMEIQQKVIDYVHWQHLSSLMSCTFVSLCNRCAHDFWYDFVISCILKMVCSEPENVINSLDIFLWAEVNKYAVVVKISPLYSKKFL